jgi:hypothetical protein
MSPETTSQLRKPFWCRFAIAGAAGSRGVQLTFIPLLTRAVPASAPGAESAENEFALPQDPLTKGACGGSRHVEPIHVLHPAAAIADEVVMTHAFRIESGGTALESYLSYQAGLHKVPQVVVGCGPGGARIDAIHSLENLRRGGMPIAFHQERHHRVALRRTAQAAALQRPLNRRNVHLLFGINLI